MNDDGGMWAMCGCLWLLALILWVSGLYGLNPVGVIIWASFIASVFVIATRKITRHRRSR